MTTTTRHTIPPQPDAHVIDGYYDSTTGDVRIQFDMPTKLEGATNCALVLDGSGSMQPHYTNGLFGHSLSAIERFVHSVGEKITELDTDHGVRTYLACLGDGRQVKDLGDRTRDDLEHQRVNLGQMGVELGSGTHFLPALKRAVKEVVVDSGCAFGFLAVLTDGRFDDFAEIKSWARDLARKIAAKEHPLTKIVLVGFAGADAAQLEELDNLDTGDVDIFNALAATDLENAMHLLNSEAITGGQIIAPGGRIEVAGQTIKNFEGGLPQRIDARIPAGLTAVTIVVQEGGEENRLEVALI